MNKKILLVAVIAVAAVLLAGCMKASDSKQVGNTDIRNPISYGNGVWYFPVQEAEFGNSLSAWIAEHPENEIITMASDDCTSYGRICGYFVVTRKAS